MTDGDLVRAGRTVRAMAEINKAGTARPAWRSWGFEHWGMRLFYAIAAGTVVNLVTGIYALGTIVAVVLFVLSTVIVLVARQRQAGTDRHP